MVKFSETTTNMSVRRTTTVNGFVQPRNPRARRRNAVANIFSDLSEADVRALREEAQNALHPAAVGASSSGSSRDSSSSEEFDQRINTSPSQRRRRNALHDIGIGIDHAQLQLLREQALNMHHPAAMATTPPGAPGGGANGDAAAAGPRRTPRSVSMLAGASGAEDYFDLPDEAGAAQDSEQRELPGPSHSFTVDSITDVFPVQGTQFPRSVSSTYGAYSLQQPQQPQQQQSSSSTSTDANIAITETDGDIFRERISRSSTRYRERRNAICYEDSTQVFLNNIISAVMRCRQQRREAATNKSSSYSTSD